ncbi:VOC family protein [Nocardia nova]|nr:VOC family protein [Nocardia nova]
MATASAPPPGFRSVTPRMVVADHPAAVAFLRTVFGATGDVEPNRPTEVRVGDSLIMVSESGEREPFPAFLYIYVDDVGATYQRAVAAGADTLEAPLDTPYGDRRAMVRDPFGNVYQIASRLGPAG